MTHVIVRYFTKDKEQLYSRGDICFASTFQETYAQDTRVKYVQYCPEINVPVDRALAWVRFLKTMWHFKTMLSGQSAQSIIDNGAFVDIDKHNVWEIFSLFTALRVMEEGKEIINAWHSYKKFISPFHAFYLAHKFSVSGKYMWNQHHMLMTTDLGMPIEELTPKIIAKQFPIGKYQPFRVFIHYRRTQELHKSFNPPKYDVGFNWQFHTTMEKAITKAFPTSHERILKRVQNCKITAKPTLPSFAVQ